MMIWSTRKTVTAASVAWRIASFLVQSRSSTPVSASTCDAPQGEGRHRERHIQTERRRATTSQLLHGARRVGLLPIGQQQAAGAMHVPR